MIEIHYFASIRESLDTDKESLALPQGTATVADLIDHLVNLHGEQWAQVLREAKVLVAINQTVAKYTSALADGDEVAFFPPVTGG